MRNLGYLYAGYVRMHAPHQRYLYPGTNTHTHTHTHTHGYTLSLSLSLTHTHITYELLERKVTMQDEGEVGVCVAKEILK